MNYKSLTKTFGKQFFLIVIAILLLDIFICLLTLFFCSRSIFRQQASEYSQAIASNIQPLLASNNANIDNITKVISGYKQVAAVSMIALFDKSGSPIYSWNRETSTEELLSISIHDNTSKVVSGNVLVHQTVNNSAGELYSIRLGYHIWTAFKDTLFNLLVGYSFMMCGIVLILFIFMQIINKEVFYPVVNLAKLSSRIISENDLSIEIPVSGNNEISKLADVIKNLLSRLKDLLSTLQTGAKNLEQINVALDQVGEAVTNNANSTKNISNLAIEKIQSLMGFFNQINNLVAGMVKQSDSGSSAVYLMNQQNQTMVTNVYTTNKAVLQATNSIEQITYSIQTNASHIDNVYNSIEAVSESMQHILSSINAQEGSTKESLSLTNELLEQTKLGFEALERTITALTNIQSTSQQLSERLVDLRHHTVDIGNTLHDIEDITKQTNLLSVNAAILSAQAGEHGRGFSVVSGEIDTLASKIQTATKQISTLINTIQEESKLAIRSTRGSFKIINQGIELGNEATEAFSVLMESADKAAVRANQIAEVSESQISEVQAVTESIAYLTKSINIIRDLSQTQAKEISALNAATMRLNNNNRQVETSSQEQERSCQNILSVINNFTAIATECKNHQQEQTSIVSKITSSVVNINNISTSKALKAAELNKIILGIKEQIGYFTSYVNQFKI